MLSSLRIKQRPSSGRPTSFRAYVDLGLLDGKPTFDGARVETEDEKPIQLTPTILPGEVEITHAENVLKYNTFSELKTGISGVLFCTNFKLSFVTAQQKPYSLHHQNFLLGENDICLINIDSVYQVGNGRRRKLLPGVTQPYPVETIEVHCKDFRVLTFSFKFSPPNTDKTFINSLLHHAFAPKINLLFAFDYSNNSAKHSPQTEFISYTKFTKPTEWIAEMKRTGCWRGWRVTQANELFILCKSLPEAFVIPAVLLDTDLSKAAPSFIGHRVLTWSWGNSKGQALVRMAVLDPSMEDDQQLIKLQEAVGQVHPKKLKPVIANLDIECCTTKDVQASFLKLKELCMPATPNEFWEQDGTFYSRLELTQWFHCLSNCLKVAKDLAEELETGTCSVIIMEQEGKDLNCVIACLIQILLESSCRTQEGFERLIEKEWICLGHPFANRLGHIKDVENEQAPIFLLYLDCVYQLTQQFPSAFEFSETYLTTLWDSTRVSVFETFLFNSSQQRQDLLKDKFNTPLKSVWNWGTQYSAQDQILFRNPLYQLKTHRELVSLSHTNARPLSLNTTMTMTSRALELPNYGEAKKHDSLLDFDPSIMSLCFWRQCYLRWVPLCNIVGGGTAVLYLQNLTVAEEIKFLSNTVKSLVSQQQSQKAKLRHRRSVSTSDEFCIQTAQTFQPNTSLITSAFPFSPIGPSEWHHFNVPSSSYLCVSYSGVEESQDD